MFVTAWKRQGDAQDGEHGSRAQVNLWQQFGVGDKIMDRVTNLRQALRVRHLKFTPLDNG